jgi:hypothetical protein
MSELTPTPRPDLQEIRARQERCREVLSNASGDCLVQHDVPLMLAYIDRLEMVIASGNLLQLAKMDEEIRRARQA